MPVTHLILLVLAVILFGVAIGFFVSYLRDRRRQKSSFQNRR
ncbi:MULTISPECIES: small membrane protein [Klebsiella pneumoniae complex]